MRLRCPEPDQIGRTPFTIRRFVPSHALFCATVAALPCLALTLPQTALAQAAPSASRVVPDSLAPVRAQPDGSIDLPATATATAPPGSDALSVKVGGVVIDGLDQAAPAAAMKAVVAERDGLAGRTVTVAELYAAAGRMEASFSRSGEVLTRVTLPPQHLSDGAAVHFLIVAGFIESVDVSALSANVQGPVRRRLAALVGKRGLTLAQIERRVLLAGDVPGVRLRSVLVRGSAPGATRLAVSGEYHVLSGSVGFDNNLGNAYEYEAFTVQLSLNSALGVGEQIYASLTTGPDFNHLFNANPRRRIAAVGAIVPIGNDGLTINPEYTRADTTPRGAAGSAIVAGRFERLVLRASYPLIRSRRENLSVTGSVEMSNEDQTVVGLGVLSRDRLRFGTLGLSYASSLGQTAIFNADGQVSVGITGLGARTRADAVASGIGLSRQGSSPDFSKANVHISIADRIGGGFDLSGVVRAQASFSGALPAAAEFSLDGSDALSSFALGTVSVDSGVTGRIELARPITVDGGHGTLITPYGFAVAGYGHVSAPTIVEAAELHSWAAGGGLRLLINAGGLATVGSVEVSHGHITSAPGAAGAARGVDPTRATVSLSLHF
ncbi:ShlB/FhaC/HecB family hemolysin secretion/activation protein [Novosphingobium sp.]|uniref:ShlB/FhaC/HecB family hemolysin secretion/activation protein n=1 Tax=Novosphingobium sp. TaxID=1874826 RepID=UPI003342777C